MIRVIDGMKYDISRKKDWIAGFKSETAIAPKCFRNFKSNGNIGYTDVLCYEITVLSGLKHSIQDYKYKDKIYLALTEKYKDSDGNVYIVSKKINIGAYIQYKNTKFTMSHLSRGNAGQLVEVDGVVFNNSDFSIKIQNLSLYKSMAYANAGVSGDNTEVVNDIPAGTHIDNVDGERTEQIEVWAYTAGYISRTPYFNWMFKEGSNTIWACDSHFKLNISSIDYNGIGYNFIKVNTEVYTDKNQLCPMNEDGTFCIPAYTEYLCVKSVDSDGYGYMHNIYMNSIDRVYGGTDEKYHRTLQGCAKIKSKYKSDINGLTYVQEFVTSATHNELGEMPEGFEQFEGNFNKYEDKNFDGVDTLQLIIQAEEEGQETEARHIYFSTQPFMLIERLEKQENGGSILASSVPVFVESLVDGDGGGYVFWVLTKYFDHQVGSTDTEFTTWSEFNSESTYPADVALRYFKGGMRALSVFENAIEDR